MYIKHLFITELSQTFQNLSQILSISQNLMKNISDIENACIYSKPDELSFKTSPSPIFIRHISAHDSNLIMVA